MIYTLYSATKPDAQENTEEEDTGRSNGPYDAELIAFDNWQNTPVLHPDVDDYARGLPNPAEYTGNLDTLDWTDHPTTTSGGLVISMRMLAVLLSVRPFPHITFPTRIYSDSIADLVRNLGGRRTQRKITDPKLFTDKFVILKLTSYTYCLDAENTILSDGVSFARTGEDIVDPTGARYAFIEPEGGLPPMFYPRHTVLYFFSEEAKAACEQAGLRGVGFEPVSYDPAS